MPPRRPAALQTRCLSRRGHHFLADRTLPPLELDRPRCSFFQRYGRHSAPSWWPSSQGTSWCTWCGWCFFARKLKSKGSGPHLMRMISPLALNALCRLVSLVILIYPWKPVPLWLRPIEYKFSLRGPSHWVLLETCQLFMRNEGSRKYGYTQPKIAAYSFIL